MAIFDLKFGFYVKFPPQNQLEMFRIWNPDQKMRKDMIYAQNLILVIFLLVKLFTKVKIARNPEGFQVPEVMDMNPTGPPELFKPSKPSKSLRKTKI